MLSAPRSNPFPSIVSKRLFLTEESKNLSASLWNCVVIQRAAAYRFGHSLLGSFVESFNTDYTPLAQEPLEAHFFSTRLIRDFSNMFGPDRISRWMPTKNDRTDMPLHRKSSE
jgi:hypothetical protein